MRGVKDKVVSLFKTNKTKDSSKPICIKKKKKRKLKLQKYSEDKIIKDKRSLFRLKKENAAIKDRIIRDIKILLDKEDY